MGGETLKLWRAVAEPGDPGPASTPGTVLAADAQGLRVQCGQGVLRATELQRAGGKRLPAAQLLHGFTLEPGMLLGGEG